MGWLLGFMKIVLILSSALLGLALSPSLSFSARLSSANLKAHVRCVGLVLLHCI